MAHQFKVGDRVRLKAEEQGYAKAQDIEGVRTIASIDDDVASFTENGKGGGAFLFRLEPAPPAPALIDPAKTYTTRDGRAVRIYATDGFGDWQAVHGAVKEGDKWDVEFWFADGRGSESGLDLIEVKPEHTRWIVVTTPEYGFDTKEEAQTVARDCDYFAVVPITFKQGDGL